MPGNAVGDAVASVAETWLAAGPMSRKVRRADYQSFIAAAYEVDTPSAPVFDSGGTLDTGPNLVWNGTGAKETLARVDQATELGPATVQAMGDAMAKAFSRALKEGSFRLVSNGGGAYLLQQTGG